MRHLQQQAFGRLRVSIPSADGMFDGGIQTAPNRLRPSSGTIDPALEEWRSTHDARILRDDEPIRTGLRFSSEGQCAAYHERLRELYLSLPPHRLCRGADDFLAEATRLNDPHEARWDALLHQLSLHNPLFVEALNALAHSLCPHAADQAQGQGQGQGQGQSMETHCLLCHPPASRPPSASHSHSSHSSSSSPSASRPSSSQSQTQPQTQTQTQPRIRNAAPIGGRRATVHASVSMNMNMSINANAPPPGTSRMETFSETGEQTQTNTHRRSQSTGRVGRPDATFHLATEGRHDKIRFRDTQPYAFNHLAHMGSWIRPGVAAIQWPLLTNLSELYEAILKANIRYIIALGPLIDVAYWRPDTIRRYASYVVTQIDPLDEPAPVPPLVSDNHSHSHSHSHNHPIQADAVSIASSTSYSNSCLSAGSSQASIDPPLSSRRPRSRPSVSDAPNNSQLQSQSQSQPLPPEQLTLGGRLKMLAQSSQSLIPKTASASSQPPPEWLTSAGLSLHDPDDPIIKDGFALHDSLEGVVQKAYLLNASHKLFVFRMPTWNDFDVPHDGLLRSVVEMAAIIRSCDERNAAIIHCRAGVGRTGTILLLAAAWQTWDLFASVDIYFELAKLRLRRPKSVQSKEQLRYVYLAMDYIVRNRLRFVPPA